MLIALLVTYFAMHTGGASASPLLGDPGRLESAIERQVKDPARLASLKALVTELKAAIRAAQARQKTGVEAVEQLATRQATTAAELETAVEALEAGQRADRDRQVALRLQLASLTTPQEFAAIYAAVFPAAPP